MPRDGFVPTGFSLDPRDFFPLTYLGGVPRGPTFNLDGWMNLTRRIRTFSATYSANDGTHFKSGSYTFDNLSDGFGNGPPVNELWIDCAIRNIASCGFNGFDSDSHFESIYYIYNTDSSYNYQIDVGISVIIGPGGSTSISSDPTAFPSAATCTFLGQDIPLFDNSATACHGSINIVGNSWWARDNGLSATPADGPIWDVFTGAKLKDPPPPDYAP